MTKKDVKQALNQDGFFTLDFQNKEPIFEAKLALETYLRQLTREPTITLENYHKLHYSDEKHVEFQFKMSEYFRQNGFAKKILLENLQLFEEVIGLDLDIQKNPYLRIARPDKTCDNIGYHRDTFYGGFPEELSVVIPFVDLPGSASLSIEPGSHILPEKNYNFEQHEIQNKDEFKNSVKHKLGFLYAPKNLLDTEKYELEPIPLKVGQALIFMLSTLHGSVVNKSSVSRWTTDVRVKNSLISLDLSSRPDYYETLSESVLRKCCEQYYKSNAKEHALSSQS